MTCPSEYFCFCLNKDHLRFKKQNNFTQWRRNSTKQVHITSQAWVFQGHCCTLSFVYHYDTINEKMLVTFTPCKLYVLVERNSERLFISRVYNANLTTFTIYLTSSLSCLCCSTYFRTDLDVWTANFTMSSLNWPTKNLHIVCQVISGSNTLCNCLLLA